MTIAICIKCGGKKFGAFSTCARCGVNPANSQQMAHSMIFSSHNYSFEELDEIAAEIAKTGKIPIFAENQEKDLLSAIENSPYLDLILAKSLPENRAVEIGNDFGPRPENILTPRGIVFRLVSEAWGWLRRDAL